MEFNLFYTDFLARNADNRLVADIAALREIAVWLESAFNDGCIQGRGEGWGDGYNEGRADGYSDGRDDGRDEGYIQGLADGNCCCG